MKTESAATSHQRSRAYPSTSHPAISTRSRGPDRTAHHHAPGRHRPRKPARAMQHDQREGQRREDAKRLARRGARTGLMHSDPAPHLLRAVRLRGWHRQHGRDTGFPGSLATTPASPIEPLAIRGAGAPWRHAFEDLAGTRSVTFDCGLYAKAVASTCNAVGAGGCQRVLA